MPRFLIEVAHDNEPVACITVAEAFLRSGSHFLMRADWGCMDGEHKAWLIVDVPTKAEAHNIVPREFRNQARVITLSAFTVEKVNDLRAKHPG